jgi:hypothetical protein
LCRSSDGRFRLSELDAPAGFASFWGVETADKLGKIEVFIVVFDLIGLWGTIQIARRYPQLNIPIATP